MAETSAITLRLEPFPKKSLADHVVQALQDEISAGRLVPGTRLPTGAQLATSYGVSRHP